MDDALGALLALAVIYIVFRWAFGGSGAAASGAAGPGGAHRQTGAAIAARRARAVPQEVVERVQAMFPHVSEAAIRYDIARSGSAEATCDRILSEGDLPPPPTGFFPTQATGAQASTARAAAAPPIGARANDATAAQGRSSATAAGSSSKPAEDLISRFGLRSKLASENDGAGDTSIASSSGLSVAETASSSQPATPASNKGKQKEQVSPAWSDSRAEREKALRSRKEALILEARRKLLKKQAAKTSTPQQSASGESGA